MRGVLPCHMQVAKSAGKLHYLNCYLFLVTVQHVVGVKFGKRSMAELN